MAATRLLFYSHDTFGLGHFRRSLTIASHLRRHLPEASILIMTGLEAAYVFETPPGIDFVKLPAVKKVGPDTYRSRHLHISFNRVRRLRENLIRAVAKSFNPHMLVVDNVPRGVDGELLPTLDFLRARRPQTKIVLTLRSVLGAGGGGDGFALLKAYADAVGKLGREGVKSVVCLGPDMPPQQRNELKKRLLPQSDRVLLFDFRPDLVSFLPLASVTVSMAGYNTVAEVLAHEKPAVVVPRVYPRREQWLRAHALEERGLLRTVDP